jgi:hypothetical protein
VSDDESLEPAPARTWIGSWILLAAIGVVIFLIGVTLGAVSRHTTTVRVTATATVTVGELPEATAPTGPIEATVGGGQTQFGDGLYRVGTDIAAGNYRTDGGKDCYWERLSNLSGGFTGIIANGEPTEPTTVRVLASDKGFSVHGGCTWTQVP